MKQIPLWLTVGGVTLALDSAIPLEILPSTAPFLGQGGAVVPVKVISVEALPPESGTPCGEDSLFSYFRQGQQFCQLAKAGTDGAVSLAVYPGDFREITLYINEGTFPGVVRTADKVLQLLPMKQLLAHFGAFLLHSSRISYHGRAILFTAPSQTGKTTQARLWREFAGAEITGNDRTLLRMLDGRIVTSGYPVDGSSPVYSSLQLPLGAVVVLSQAPENHVNRLPATRALSRLMEQSALDGWNGEERMAATRFWLQLLEQSPVYGLACRPDQGAVQCLKLQLERDEVIPLGTD